MVSNKYKTYSIISILYATGFIDDVYSQYIDWQTNLINV